MDYLNFDAKRNLLSNSAEFYNLSYEYINDCLKAGLAFRREFYRDRDVEPEDLLIFKITFSPLDKSTSLQPLKIKRFFYFVIIFF